MPFAFRDSVTISVTGRMKTEEPMSAATRSEADLAFEQYRILLELWSKENPINALLVSGVGLGDDGF